MNTLRIVGVVAAALVVSILASVDATTRLLPAAGVNGSIQYNAAGNVAGDSNLLYDGTFLTAPNLIGAPVTGGNFSAFGASNQTFGGHVSLFGGNGSTSGGQVLLQGGHGTVQGWAPVIIGNVTGQHDQLLLLWDIPTSDPLIAGAVWNDAGTLKISAVTP